MTDEELFDVLSQAREQLMDMQAVADDSVADFVLDIQVAVQFIDKALRTHDRLDVFKALQKAKEALEKEYQEEPEDTEYDNLVDKIKSVVGESNSEDHGEALDKTGFWGRQGAGCIFLARTTGRLLLPLRSAMVLQPGTWGVWGGAIDSGENPQEAVKREASEEVGFKGIIEKLIPLYVYHDLKTGFKYHNFLAIVDDEFNPHLNWETERYKWVEFGDWPSPLHFGLKALLQNSGDEIKRIVDSNARGEGL